MAKTKIIFLILPHIHLLDLAGADQVFHEAIEQGATIEMIYCSIGEPIVTSTNLPFGKLINYSKVTIFKGDYIFIPGAEVNYLISRKINAEKKLLQWVKDSYLKGANICSICTGAFFLAMAGLLDGRKCTTHWKRTSQLQKMYPEVQVIENILFTEDENIYTSAGVTAGIDLALHIVSKLKDDNFSYKIARELVVYVRRQGSDSQKSIFMDYRNHIHSGIHKVQDHLQENIRKKQTLTRLSSIACMSPRNFTRVFRKETGISVNDYITLIRKEHIKEFLKNPDMTRKKMALECGLQSERQIIRLINEIKE